MKDSTKKIINEQLKLVIQELNEVLDPKDRIDRRLELIELLAEVSEKMN